MTEYDSLRQYYGPVLGNHTGYVREYAAAAFCIALTQLNVVKLGKHYNKIIKALVGSSKLLCASNSDTTDVETDLLSTYDINILLTQRRDELLVCEEAASVAAAAKGPVYASVPKRTGDIFDGISYLLFNTLKGIRGQQHSKAHDRIQLYFDVMLPPTPASTSAMTATNGHATSVGKVTKSLSAYTINSSTMTAGFIFMYTIKKMFYHLAPRFMGDLWECLLLCAKKLMKQVRAVVAEISKSISASGSTKSSAATPGKKGKKSGGGDAVAVVSTQSVNAQWETLHMEAYSIALVVMVEVLIYGLSNADGRAVRHSSMKKAGGLSSQIVSTVLELCQLCLSPVLPMHAFGEVRVDFHHQLKTKTQKLFCVLVERFSAAGSSNALLIANKLETILAAILPTATVTSLLSLSQTLFPLLNIGSSTSDSACAVIRQFVSAVGGQCERFTATNTSDVESGDMSVWLTLAIKLCTRIYSHRRNVAYTSSTKSTLKVASRKHRLPEEAISDTAKTVEFDDDKAIDAGCESDGDAYMSDSSDEGNSTSRVGIGANGGTDVYAVVDMNKDSLSLIVSCCVQLLSNFVTKQVKDVSLLISSLSMNELTLYVHATKIIEWMCVLRSDPKQAAGRSYDEIFSTIQIDDVLSAVNSFMNKYFNSSDKRFSAAIGEVSSDDSKIKLLSVLSHTASLQCTLVTAAARLSKTPISVIEKMVPVVVRSTDTVVDALMHVSSTSLSLLSAIVNQFCCLFTELPELVGGASTPTIASWTMEGVFTGESMETPAQLFSTIAMNICSPSHWVRLAMLQIASFYPSALLKPESVVKKAAASASNDDDDDAEQYGHSSSSPAEEEEVPEYFDVVRLCWEIASIKIGLSYEREFARLMGTLEVVIRGQRLPDEFMQFAVSFCFGVLNVKFKPLWDAALRVLVTAMNYSVVKRGATATCETKVREIFFQQLESLMNREDPSERTLAVLAAGAATKVTVCETGELSSKDKRKDKKKKTKGKEKDKDSFSTSAGASAEEEAETGGQPALLSSAGEHIEASYKGLDERGAVDSEYIHFMSSAVNAQAIDSGEECVPENLAVSDTFYYSTAALAADEQARSASVDDNIKVYHDARTDSDTLYGLVWGMLKQCSDITLRQSKSLVPLFFRFLREQYYSTKGFADDAEVPALVHVGVLLVAPSSSDSDMDVEPTSNTSLLPRLSLRVLKKRLELFLEIFGAVSGPKGLYMHSLLYQYYTITLSKPDTAVVKLALACVLTYKPVHIMPYATQLKNILDDKLIRDELLSFDLSPEGDGLGSTLAKDHRAEVLPILTSIIYGRLISKSRDSSKAARDQSLARRHAIMVFLTRAAPAELSHFFLLMMRGVLPTSFLVSTASANTFNNLPKTDSSGHATYAASSESFLLNCVSKQSILWNELVFSQVDHLDAKTAVAASDAATAAANGSEGSSDDCVGYISAERCRPISLERQLGFLYLLQEAIKTFGLEFQIYIPLCCKLLIYILGVVHHSRLSVMNKLSASAAADGGEDTGAVDEDEGEVDDEHFPSAEKEDEVAACVDSKNNSYETFKLKRLLLQLSKLRSMSLVRFSELISQFQDIIGSAMESLTCGIWQYVIPSLPTLVSSVSSSSKPPALLKLLQAFVVPSSARFMRGEKRFGNNNASSCVFDGAEYQSDVVSSYECITSRRNVLTTLIECVAAPVQFAVFGVIMETLTELFSRDVNGNIIMPYGDLLIKCFTARFTRLRLEEASVLQLDSISAVKIVITGSSKMELRLLCDIAKAIHTSDYTVSKKKKAKDSNDVIDSTAVGNLAIILLSMLRTYTSAPKFRLPEQWVIDIITTYQSLLSRIPDISNHVGFVSRLFGPSAHSFSLFNLASVRCALASCYADMAAHHSVGGFMSVSATCLIELTAIDKGVLDSKDFGRCMPIFQGLAGNGAAGTTTWSQVLGPEAVDTKTTEKVKSKLKAASGCRRAMTLCTVVVHETVRCMYDADYVTRTAALSALRQLVVDCIQWQTAKQAVVGTDGDQDSWLDLLSNLLMTEVHKALKMQGGATTDTVRKGFLELLSHTVRVLRAAEFDQDSKTQASLVLLHTDIGALMHVDPEQDFFENITHIQYHRRMRALGRVSALFIRWSATQQGRNTFSDFRTEMDVEDAVDDGAVEDYSDIGMDIEGGADAAGLAMGASHAECPFSLSTMTNVLLPIAFAPLMSDEYLRKEFHALKQEAGKLIGCICLALPWTQYHGLLRKILKELDKLGKKRKAVELAAHEKHHGNAAGGGASGGSAMVKQVTADFETKEKFLITAMCNVLDAFHFDTSEADTSVPVEEEEAAAEDDDHDVEADVEADVEVETETQLANVTTVQVHGAGQETNISQAAIRSIYPWVKTFLLKEDIDKEGQKSKVVRPMVAVALTKLIAKLTPMSMADVGNNLTENKKRDLFVGLVMTIVTTLKNRDATARDTARSALSQMIKAMGMESLCAVLYELNHSLTEGYQRHVRVYSVRSILTDILSKYSVAAEYLPENYKPMEATAVPTEMIGDGNTDSSSSSANPMANAHVPEFDKCIPLIMESVLDDLLGDANSDRSTDDAVRTLIREAKGVKAYDILEEVSKHIVFRPTSALTNGSVAPETVSSVHALLNPIFALLLRSASSSESMGEGFSSKDPFVLSLTIINRISEALLRISQGLAKNTTVVPQEVLIYVFATLLHCVQMMNESYRAQQVALGKIYPTSVISAAADKAKSGTFVDDDDDILGELPSYLLEEESDEEEQALYSKKKKKNRSDRDDDVTGYRAKVWLSKDGKGGGTGGSGEFNSKAALRDALLQRDLERKNMSKVYDGASAPKLTGFDRHVVSASRRHAADAASGSGGGVEKSQGDSNISVITLAKFCLTLLNACLKNNKIDETDASVRSMLKPFLPILANCLCLPGTAAIAPMAMRCLCTLLAWGLELDAKDNRFSKAVGVRMVKLMFRNGTLLSSDSDLVQACLKGLTSLFHQWNKANHANYNKKLGRGGMKMTEVMELPPAMTEDGVVAATSSAVVSAEDADMILSPAEYGTGGKRMTQQQIKETLPLKETNIKLLLQLVNSHILEVTSSFQTAAFQLLRGIIDTQILLPEIYDVITTLTEQMVLSHRQGIRSASMTIVIAFIINYPLSDKRLTGHIKQLLKNCEYEYEEGRLAAIEMMHRVVKLLPVPVLDDFSQVIFFSLTLRLVNEQSRPCRVGIESVIASLIRRISSELVVQYLDYCKKWLGSCKRTVDGSTAPVDEWQTNFNSDDEDDEGIAETAAAAVGAVGAEGVKQEVSVNSLSLVRTGAQVIQLFIVARPDICKRYSIVDVVVKELTLSLSLLMQYHEYEKQCREIKGLVAEVKETELLGPEDETAGETMELVDVYAGGNRRDAPNTSELFVGEANKAASVNPAVYDMLSLLNGCFAHLPTLTETACGRMIHPSTETNINTDECGEATLLGDFSRNIMELVQECMLLDHHTPLGVNIRCLSVRLLKKFLARRKLETMVQQLNSSSNKLSNARNADEFLLQDNSLFQLSRRLCLVLMLHSTNDGHVILQKESADVHSYNYSSTLTDIITCLVYVIRIFIHCDAANHSSLRARSNTAHATGNEKSSKNKNKGGKKRSLSVVNINDDDEDDDKDHGENETGGFMDEIFDGHQDDEEDEELDEQEDGASESEHENEEETKGSGVNWIMQRLRGIGLDFRGSRRYTVCSLFKQLVLEEGNNTAFIEAHLMQMCEVAFRAWQACSAAGEVMGSSANLGVLSGNSGSTSSAMGAVAGSGASNYADEVVNADKIALHKVTYECASDCLQLLERSVDSSIYVGTLSAVQEKMKSDKASRKEAEAREAVLDPKAYAQRRGERNDRKKEQRRHKNEQFAAMKGKRIPSRDKNNGSRGVSGGANKRPRF